MLLELWPHWSFFKIGIEYGLEFKPLVVAKLEMVEVVFEEGIRDFSLKVSKRCINKVGKKSSPYSLIEEAGIN